MCRNGVIVVVDLDLVVVRELSTLRHGQDLARRHGLLLIEEKDPIALPVRGVQPVDIAVLAVPSSLM